MDYCHQIRHDIAVSWVSLIAFQLVWNQESHHHCTWILEVLKHSESFLKQYWGLVAERSH